MKTPNNLAVVIARKSNQCSIPNICRNIHVSIGALITAESKSLLDKGFIPVIAHPERNLDLQKAPLTQIRKYTDMGCKLQSNILSMFELYGKRVKQYMEALLTTDLISYLGTDMHNADISIDSYKKAFEEIMLKTGRNRFLSFFKED